MNADPIDPSAMVDSLVPKGGPPVSNAKGSPICGVYGIWCEANEKWYVGQSIDIVERWKQHLRDLRRGAHHSQPLQRTWNKYGEGAFLWTVLDRCPAEELEKRENEETESLAAMAPAGFVLFSGGKTRAASAETRKKMSVSRSREKHHFYGKHFSPEHKAALSAARKGYTPTQATREKISRATRGPKHRQWGKPLSEVQRAALSKANTGHVPTAAAREARHQTNLRRLVAWRKANDIPDGSLKCRMCGHVGPLEEFKKSHKCLEGRAFMCSDCFNQRRAKQRAEKRNEQKARKPASAGDI